MTRRGLAVAMAVFLTVVAAGVVTLVAGFLAVSNAPVQVPAPVSVVQAPDRVFAHGLGAVSRSSRDAWSRRDGERAGGLTRVCRRPDPQSTEHAVRLLRCIWCRRKVQI